MPRLRRRAARRRRRQARGRFRAAAAAGARREGARPAEAEVDRRLAAEDGRQRPVPGDRAHGRRRRSRTCCRSSAAGPATRRRHHPAGGDHADPRTGGRNVGMYRMQKIDARSTYMHWQLHKDGRADWLAAKAVCPSPWRSASTRSRVQRERASAEAHRRVHARRLPQGRAGGARRLQDDPAAGSRRAPRSCSRADPRRRAGDRGPVRRPHGLLLAGRAVPDLPT